MSWTLAELSKIETDVLRKSVVDALLMESNLLELCPWETIGQLSTGIIKVQNLPSVGFRKINAGYTESTGHFEHAVENIALMGVDIDTDIAIARAKNTIADARAIQQAMSLRAMAFAFNDKFINGDPTTAPADALEYKGLRKRVDDISDEGYTNQKILTSVTASTGILNSSNESHNFLNDLDKLIYAISGHKPDFLLMNMKMLLALRSVLRKEKLLDNTRDMFDRVVDVYQGCRLIDIGVKADQSTEVITSTETVAGVDAAADEHTSIYAVKFGVGEMTWGIQEYPLEVRDLGELEDKPVFRTRVDFPLGLATINPRSLARLYGVIPDASAA